MTKLKNALFSIGNYKAPGSDGFLSKFFKAAWDIVGRDVELAIHNFFYRGNLPKNLNYTLICLLPKSVNASRVTDYRPIACCTMLYNALTSSGPPRCVFKIDIKKAYDTVERFLIVMLQGLGFHPVLVKWIREMVSTASYSLAINGNSYGFFHGGRGLRQGDPLSPYLFTIVMEGFPMLLKHCIRETTDFGYHQGCEELDLTHLCFADDLFVFTKGDVLSVEVLKKALFLFQSRSRLAPSLEKSEIYFGNVPPNIKEAILECLPFKLGLFPVRYLGVPLSQARLKLCDYAPLIAMVKGRILNWKSKFLSFGGRRQLIVSEFPLQGMILVVDVDYLGIWSVDLLLLEALGLSDCPLGIELYLLNMKSSNWSSVFRKPLDLRSQLRRFLFSQVGDGQDTIAWEDGWLSCGHLSDFISYWFVHSCGFSTSTTVCELLMGWDGVRPDDWSNRFAELHSSLLPSLSDLVRDRVLWGEDHTSSLEFTVMLGLL
ncbi:uncharacterized protein LOC112523778 [Cynara cardunculus var. scolymus]|uniref:uncharacterized protein LOC112523778 n=1 Tax=Cynara cardunculus var. scolymus TaxID=59895 RepID=UPI000D623708|nr:uncharacterized protein LOC112523778 [Cynara cardunculus var. scolymus]